MTTRDITGTTAVVTGASRGFGRAVAGYARREDVDVATFVERRGPVLRADQVGDAVVELVTAASSPPHDAGAHILTAAGLAPAP